MTQANGHCERSEAGNSELKFRAKRRKLLPTAYCLSVHFVWIQNEPKNHGRRKATEKSLPPLKEKYRAQQSPKNDLRTTRARIFFLHGPEALFLFCCFPERPKGAFEIVLVAFRDTACIATQSPVVRRLHRLRHCLRPREERSSDRSSLHSSLIFGIITP